MSLTGIWSEEVWTFGKNPQYSMFRTILLKDFDFAYLQCLKLYSPEFVPVYKTKFEQVFDTSLLECKSLIITSKNTIKALLHHHVNRIDDMDVYIVGPKTAEYFKDCFGVQPKLIGNDSQDLINKLKTVGSSIQEPILFATGHQHHNAIPIFLKDYDHFITPMYSVDYIINESYFDRYSPDGTRIIVFSPEMAKRIPNRNWSCIICIGHTTRNALIMDCPIYVAKEPTPPALLDILQQLDLNK